MSTPPASKLATTLRWIARIWSLGSIGIVLLFALGEGFNPAALQFKEELLFLCFPFAVLIGLALAWKWPVAGGMLSIVGLLGFYFLHLVFADQFPAGFAFIVIALPGWLFILSELLAPKASVMNQKSDATPC